MFINVKKDGKIIACYRKEIVMSIGYENGVCTVQTINDLKSAYTITEQDFSDLVSQLKQD